MIKLHTNDETESDCRKKKIIVGILLCFVLVNVLWLINYYTYYKYTDGYMKSPVSYIKSGEDYTYTVACPRYLHMTGNFALSNNDDISIIIWPGLYMIGENEYGLHISDNESGVYNVYVDKQLNYLNNGSNTYTVEEQKKINALIKERADELEEMCELVEEEWSR